MVFAQTPDGVVEPNPFLWVMVVVWLALGIGVFRLLPRVWRNDAALMSRLDEVFGALGPKTSSAALRSVPVAGVVLVLSGVLLAAGLVREVTEGALRDVADVLTKACLFPFLAALVVFFGVILFNRPKRAVPPALREGRGVVL